jgi:hypothetical protein
MGALCNTVESGKQKKTTGGGQMVAVKVERSAREAQLEGGGGEDFIRNETP